LTTLVSILIPVFNRGWTISDTINSALAQTYRNIEIIIVDNASTDESWRVIQSFLRKDSRIKAFRNRTNLGPVRNWLRCVEEASGQYGKILWSDDLIAPEFVEKSLPLFNDEVGFVYSGVNVFAGDDPLEGKLIYLLRKTGIYPTSLYVEKAIFDKGMPASPGCAIFRLADIRKNLWLDIPNKVNSDFSMHAIGNDLLLFLLTANEYNYFGHIAEPLSFFRSHSGSISISSGSGKLPLHYALAQAHFVERFAPCYANRLAAKIQILLWRFKDSKKYGMCSVSDFFILPISIDKLFLLKELIFKLASRAKSFVKYFLRKDS
jgi:glycosyltransferase involved in cell wall biosynthesis